MSKSNGHGGGGPCGACKFLRRKCVKGCIFAPYFDSEQGASHFAAVHKVFGASNVSKLLLSLPVHDRLDAALTICYEALARIKDPVYGCVGHIFALQQQVVNLQAELAFVQAHLSTMELPPQPISPTDQSPACASLLHVFSDNSVPSSGISALLDPMQVQQIWGMGSCWNQAEQDLNNGDLPALAREFVSKYLPEARFRPPDSC
ncbi:LOB domain-containing protein 19-like [Macadamia integrifolia]|uniref:LOB domain-containing protein 19-like n=1 Tax=Macadamia integrifolia TaxID=60698 RepID=UPI001C4EEBF9|nr:LOB domain-containing protein 19-like [Macadamia integrifolia]